MAEPSSAQDKANSVLWLATREGNMGRSGFPALVLQILLQTAKSFNIDQAFWVKMAG